MLDEVKKELDKLFSEGDVSAAIGVAGGAFSVCWENPAGAGVFQSTEAAELAEYLYQGVLAYIRKKITTGQQGPIVDAYSVKTGLTYPSAEAAQGDANILGGRHTAVDPHSAGGGRHNPEAEHRGSER